jgi:type VI protein secretion system component Hcp
MSIFLDIQQPLIAGESMSQNQNWNNKVELQHWVYDVSQSTSQEVGTGLVSSGSRVSHIHVTKVMDKSSPLLFAQLCAGKPIDLMFIRASAPGAAGGANGGLFEGETMQIGNVIVSSYHTSGNPGSGGLPTETWAFSFTKMKETFQTVDGQGNMQPAQTFGQDFGMGTSF